MFPYLKEKIIRPLERAEKNEIATNIKSLFVYRLGSIILESTDSIFISKLVSLATVGLYANYKIIINLFNTIGSQIMNPIVASIGNLNAQAESAKKEKVFYELLLIVAWFYGFVTIGMYIFISPVVNLWFGESFLIGTNAVLAACVYFFVSGMHNPCYIYRSTAGLFVFGKYVPVACAVLNIILDILLGRVWGLAGILWASSISRLITYELIDPIILYKRIFNKRVRGYFLRYLLYILLISVCGFIGYFASHTIVYRGIIGLILRVLIFSLVFNSIFLAVTIRTESMKSIMGRLAAILKKYR